MKIRSALYIGLILIVFTACTQVAPEPTTTMGPSYTATLTPPLDTPKPIPTENNKSNNNELLIKSADFRLDTQSIIYDGEYILIANEGTLPGNEYYIFQVDPNTGQVVQKWMANSPCENGSTYDGQFLWTVGNHSPLGINPPWEDKHSYDLIYKYSIVDNELNLESMYALDSQTAGLGDNLTIDNNGNLWAIPGLLDPADKTILSRLALYPDQNADHITDLPEVKKAEIVERILLPISAQKLKIKAVAWIDNPSIGNYIVVSGYPNDESIAFDNFTYVLDANNGYSIKWENFSYRGPDHFDFGPFGLYWDNEEEILWVINGETIMWFTFDEFIELIKANNSTDYSSDMFQDNP